MSRVLEWATKERWAAVVAVVLAAVQLAVGFGLQLSGEQVALITGFVTAVGGLVIQSKVVSARTHESALHLERTMSFDAGKRAAKVEAGHIDAQGAIVLLVLVVLVVLLARML